MSKNKKTNKKSKSWLQQAFPPVHSEGVKFTLIAALIAFLFLMVYVPLGLFLFIITICVYGFFRDPERMVPEKEGLVVSPADGKICEISRTTLPKELEMPNVTMKKISVFMSVFNVHVNRCPIAGTVEKMVYIPGKFINAEFDKASEDNERQLYLVKTKNGSNIAFVQIAGLIARRILAEVEEGDELETGERFGLIRFGSRVDVYLPETAEIRVVEGQTMIAGETVIAKM